MSGPAMPLGPARVAEVLLVKATVSRGAVEAKGKLQQGSLVVCPGPLESTSAAQPPTLRNGSVGGHALNRWTGGNSFPSRER